MRDVDERSFLSFLTGTHQTPCFAGSRSHSRSGGMADAMDSKSIVPKGRVGSSPTFGTLSTFTFRNFFNLKRLRNAVFYILGTETKTGTKLGF